MSDTEDTSFKTAVTDLNSDMDAQSNNGTPDRIPFNEKVKALERNLRKRKIDSMNLRSTTMDSANLRSMTTDSNQPLVCATMIATNRREMASLVAPLVSSQFSMHTATSDSFKVQLTA